MIELTDTVLTEKIIMTIKNKVTDIANKSRL